MNCPNCGYAAMHFSEPASQELLEAKISGLERAKEIVERWSNPSIIEICEEIDAEIARLKNER